MLVHYHRGQPVPPAIIHPHLGYLTLQSAKVNRDGSVAAKYGVPNVQSL